MPLRLHHALVNPRFLTKLTDFSCFVEVLKRGDHGVAGRTQELLIAGVAWDKLLGPRVKGLLPRIVFVLVLLFSQVESIKLDEVA